MKAGSDPPHPLRSSSVSAGHLKLLSARSFQGARTLTWKPTPESGLDCLKCADFARQRWGVQEVGVQVQVNLAALVEQLDEGRQRAVEREVRMISPPDLLQFRV